MPSGCWRTGRRTVRPDQRAAWAFLERPGGSRRHASRACLLGAAAATILASWSRPVTAAVLALGSGSRSRASADCSRHGPGRRLSTTRSIQPVRAWAQHRSRASSAVVLGALIQQRDPGTSLVVSLWPSWSLLAFGLRAGTTISMPACLASRQFLEQGRPLLRAPPDRVGANSSVRRVCRST